MQRRIPSELKVFLQNKELLPCSIKVCGDNLEYSKCFMPVSIENIEYRSINEYSNEIINTHEKNKTIGILDLNNYLEINVLHSDAIFKKKANKVTQLSSKSNHYIGKYILYSINLKPDFYIFSKYYLDRFNEIAKNSLDDTQKAKELDDIFQSIGYFAPLQIDIGAMFTSDMNILSSHLNKESSYKIDSNTKNDYFSNKFNIDILNSEDIEKLFSNKKKNIKGGDIFQENFDKWKKTVTLNNADIIGYKNLIKIQDLLDYKLKNALRNPLEIIEKKYETRKKFFEIIENLTEHKNKKEIKGKVTIGNGITKEQNHPKIVRQNLFEIRGESKFLSYDEQCFSEHFIDIIVGWKIISRWNDGTNGKYNIEEDPLLTHNANIKFFSQFCRGQSFNIEIYTMKIPD